MAIYFAFSDENGSYQQIKSPKFLRSHPYYCRSTFAMDASEWKGLNHSLAELKRSVGLPSNRELKWAYLWSLAKHQKDGIPITADKPYYFLKDHSYTTLLEFCRNVLILLSGLSFVKIIITVTDNAQCPTHTDYLFHHMHLQDLMQRLEMEFQNDTSNLCILFVDPLSAERENLYLRNIYSSIFTRGDFIKQYKHVKDSLNIELSHQSAGIQIADYISGCFLSFIKQYPAGKSMFVDCVYPHLRSGHGGKVMGFGIREEPKDLSFRARIERLLAVTTSASETFPKLKP